VVGTLRGKREGKGKKGKKRRRHDPPSKLVFSFYHEKGKEKKKSMGGEGEEEERRGRGLHEMAFLHKGENRGGEGKEEGEKQRVRCRACLVSSFFLREELREQDEREKRGKMRSSRINDHMKPEGGENEKKGEEGRKRKGEE